MRFAYAGLVSWDLFPAPQPDVQLLLFHAKDVPEIGNNSLIA